MLLCVALAQMGYLTFVASKLPFIEQRHGSLHSDKAWPDGDRAEFFRWMKRRVCSLKRLSEEFFSLFSRVFVDFHVTSMGFHGFFFFFSRFFEGHERLADAEAPHPGAGDRAGRHAALRGAAEGHEVEVGDPPAVRGSTPAGPGAGALPVLSVHGAGELCGDDEEVPVEVPGLGVQALQKLAARDVLFTPENRGFGQGFGPFLLDKYPEVNCKELCFELLSVSCERQAARRVSVLGIGSSALGRLARPSSSCCGPTPSSPCCAPRWAFGALSAGRGRSLW